MQELDRRVGLLRLLLADLAARRQQLEDGQAQLRLQIARIADYTVRGTGAVGPALSGMAELEERMARAEVDLRHLEMLRRRARDELDALLVTRGVADAQARLSELERRRAELLAAASSAEGAARPAELEEIEAEMAALRQTIEAASDAAARALTGRGDARG